MNKVTNTMPGKLSTPLIDAFMTRKPIRTGSLIVSVFGDSIAPRGGEVWLGSLIRTLTPLGISQRVVRTAVFRLVKDGILQNTQIGRRSYYALTEAGKLDFEQATTRIYHAAAPAWDGSWCLVLTSSLRADARNKLRRHLKWQGFGLIGADLLAHPAADLAALQRTLRACQCDGDVVIFKATKLPDLGADLATVVRDGWNLSDLETAYAQYVAEFATVLTGLQETTTLADVDAFYIRIFAIHEYRKILLRDPGLPAELLPGNWHGTQAFNLARDIYVATWRAAEAHINSNLENQQGMLPHVHRSFYARFDGLS